MCVCVCVHDHASAASSVFITVMRVNSILLIAKFYLKNFTKKKKSPEIFFFFLSLTQCVMLLLSPENIKVPILVQNLSCDNAGRSILICFFPNNRAVITHHTKKMETQWSWRNNIYCSLQDKCILTKRRDIIVIIIYEFGTKAVWTIKSNSTVHSMYSIYGDSTTASCLRAASGYRTSPQWMLNHSLTWMVQWKHCPAQWHRLDGAPAHDPAAHALTRPLIYHSEMSGDVGCYMAPRWHDGGERHDYLMAAHNIILQPLWPGTMADRRFLPLLLFLVRLNPASSMKIHSFGLSRASSRNTGEIDTVL